MLLGIILFPLSMRFSLICRMWAFSITHNRPLGRANWAFILGWRQRSECFNGRAFSLGLVSGPAMLFFKPYQVSTVRLNLQPQEAKGECEGRPSLG